MKALCFEASPSEKLRTGCGGKNAILANQSVNTFKLALFSEKIRLRKEKLKGRENLNPRGTWQRNSVCGRKQSITEQKNN
jgi:hypothetical protein